jgi:chemotaxis protein MotB
MKCFATPSHRPTPHPMGLAEATPGRRLISVVAVVLGAGLVLGGCVSRGAHQQLQDEYASLRSEKRSLEKKLEYVSATNRSLEEERLRLSEGGEDLREARMQLEQRVQELEISEAELAAKLAVQRREFEKRSIQLETQTQRVSEMRGAYEGLVSDLESQVASGQIEIAQLREGLRVNVSQDVLFPSGSATLNTEGREVLLSVAKNLAELPYRIEVEGHSDNVKISGALVKRYPSNWELAGARAASVVRLFLESGIDGERLSAVSRGMYHPVAPNDSAEGRSLNRRIEIRLLPDESAQTRDLDDATASGVVSGPGVESAPGQASEQP